MDFTMSLQPHGWLDIMIYTTEGEKIEIPVSFLSDAIHEIASKTSSLGISDNDVIITSLLQLFEMSDNFSCEAIEEGTLEGFKERWNSDFPINAYNGLSETIHKLK